MKKQILILFLICLLLSACGKISNNEKQNTSSVNSESIKDTEQKENPDNENTFTDHEVELIFVPITVGEELDIEQYVKDLNESDNENYYVYDNEHYAKKIKESERLEMLEKINNTELLSEELVVQLNESYPGVFKKVKFENLGKDIYVYVDKEKYESSDFGVALVALFSTGATAQFIQSYNLLDLNDRTSTFKIIDFKTNDIIYEE